MANEITTGNLVTNGGMVDLILSDLVLEKIYDGTVLSSTMLFIDWHALMLQHSMQTRRLH